ncbi:MAG: formate dehydrogenase accessory protein FdhE [Deltaproteobacteria bacterium]|nr:formate dehydrogenase accessory protein FdhE [Deltaproteobacteria bacterium]
MSHHQHRLQRLNELRKIRPQYGEIYDFYQGLCTFLQEMPSAWFACTVDLEAWQPRRQAGFPLLSRETLQFDEAGVRAFLFLLIDRLIDLGRQGAEELQCFKQALENDALSAAELLLACLEKDRAPVEKAATQLELPAALLEYVLSTTLAHGLQQWLAGQPEIRFEDWSEGYCPICGGIPVMGELSGETGKKRLHCSLCATAWEVVRMKCSYCGNDETDSLEYFTAEGDVGYRVDICRKCSCYLKVVDSREVGDGLPMDVEDLNTMHLDLLAQREGFAKGKREQKN